ETRQDRELEPPLPDLRLPVFGRHRPRVSSHALDYTMYYYVCFKAMASGQDGGARCEPARHGRAGAGCSTPLLQEAPDEQRDLIRRGIEREMTDRKSVV